MDPLSTGDPRAAELLAAEETRQRATLELIPSENYASPAVRQALGSVLTNVYSEGYPGKRYYGGQAVIDQVELLAIERARGLFGAEHVNVQPYSGSTANAAVYFGLLNAGDGLMGMSLPHGGHITHGLPISFSGRTYRIIPYGVDPSSGRIDMDAVRAIALREKPRMLIAGFTAYTRDLDWEAYRRIADEVGALLFADISHIAGLIAGGALENPVPLVDVATTTTHKTLRGPRGAIILSKAAHAKALDRAVFPGLQGGPHDHVTLAKAVAFGEAATPAFRAYAAQVIANARALAAELLARGHALVTGGTDNHMLLLDLRPFSLGGKRAQEILESAGLVANMNTIPDDPRPPMDPSGLRLGTPAITTRGMREPEMRQIAAWMDAVLRAPDDAALHAKVAAEVRELATAFPPPA